MKRGSQFCKSLQWVLININIWFKNKDVRQTLIYVDGDDRQDLDEAGPEDREDENVAVDQMTCFGV